LAKAVRVRIRLFATYREIVGRGDAHWAGTEGATLGDLLADLLARYPGLAGHRGSMLLAVNHEFADPSTVLRDGDEIAILPPVSGGLR